MLLVPDYMLYMKTIHSAKIPNDRIYSQKIGVLLRRNVILTAYIYPEKMRAIRGLSRNISSQGLAAVPMSDTV